MRGSNTSSSLLFGTRKAPVPIGAKALTIKSLQGDKHLDVLVKQLKTGDSTASLAAYNNAIDPIYKKALRKPLASCVVLIKADNPIHQNTQRIMKSLGISNFDPFSGSLSSKAADELENKIIKDGDPTDWIKYGEYAVGVVVSENIANHIAKNPYQAMKAADLDFPDFLQGVSQVFNNRVLMSEKQVNDFYKPAQMQEWLEKFYAPANWKEPKGSANVLFKFDFLDQDDIIGDAYYRSMNDFA